MMLFVLFLNVKKKKNNSRGWDASVLRCWLKEKLINTVLWCWAFIFVWKTVTVCDQSSKTKLTKHANEKKRKTVKMRAENWTIGFVESKRASGITRIGGIESVSKRGGGGGGLQRDNKHCTPTGKTETWRYDEGSDASTVLQFVLHVCRWVGAEKTMSPGVHHTPAWSFSNTQD